MPDAPDRSEMTPCTHGPMCQWCKPVGPAPKPASEIPAPQFGPGHAYRPRPRLPTAPVVHYRVDVRLNHRDSRDWVTRASGINLATDAREALDWYRDDEPQNEVRCVRITEQVIDP